MCVCVCVCVCVYIYIYIYIYICDSTHADWVLIVATEYWYQNLKERSNLGDKGMDTTIILTLSLNKYGASTLSGLT